MRDPFDLRSVTVGKIGGHICQILIHLTIELPGHGGHQALTIANIPHLLQQIFFSQAGQLGKGCGAVAICTVACATGNTFAFPGSGIADKLSVGGKATHCPAQGEAEQNCYSLHVKSRSIVGGDALTALAPEPP